MEKVKESQQRVQPVSSLDALKWDKNGRPGPVAVKNLIKH
jgi:hypothetical protein